MFEGINHHRAQFKLIILWSIPPSRRLIGIPRTGLKAKLQRGPTLRCLSAMEVHMKNFYMYEEG